MQNWIEKLGLGERAASMVVWIGLSVFLLVVVLALAVWLIKTLRPTLNIGGSHGRSGRPQRLAITDAFTLDREGRKLVIIRRDNVEHLLLIGGPNDVLVEPCIVRGERGLRDRGARGGAEAEMLHAAETPLATEVPHAEAPTMPTMAPSAPMTAPPASPMTAPMAAPITLPSFRSVAPPPPKSPAPARLDDEFERALAAMQAAQRQQAALRPQPPVSAPPHPVAPPPALHPNPVAPAAPQPAPERPARHEPTSEMARRLNEVLQKPLSGTLRPPFNRPIPPVPATLNSAPKPAPVPNEAPPAAPESPPAPSPASAPPPAPAAAADPAAPAPAESEMDLLEEEMARLLGRAPEPKKPGAT